MQGEVCFVVRQFKQGISISTKRLLIRFYRDRTYTSMCRRWQFSQRLSSDLSLRRSTVECSILLWAIIIEERYYKGFADWKNRLSNLASSRYFWISGLEWRNPIPLDSDSNQDQNLCAVLQIRRALLKSVETTLSADFRYASRKRCTRRLSTSSSPLSTLSTKSTKIDSHTCQVSEPRSWIRSSCSVDCNFRGAS